MPFFLVENQNVLIFLGFETQKSGQLRLKRDGWQVCSHFHFVCRILLNLCFMQSVRRFLIHQQNNMENQIEHIAPFTMVQSEDSWW